MKNSYPLAMTLATLFATLSLSADPLSLQEVAGIGKKTTDAFHHRLGSELREHKKEGIVATAQFCIDNAQAISEDFNNELGSGVKIRRISLKNRNDNNNAGADEAPILEALELLANANAYLPGHIIQINDAGDYKYYRPISLSKRDCMACHGQPENMAGELRSLFKESYPNDKALCYNRGDLRGAFVVEIRQKKPSSKNSNQTKTKD
jgi:hypothetical protein